MSGFVVLSIFAAAQVSGAAESGHPSGQEFRLYWLDISPPSVDPNNLNETNLAQLSVDSLNGLAPAIAMQTYRSAGNTHGVIRELLESARHESLNGNFARARALLDEASGLSVKNGDDEGQAAALSNTGVVEAALGHYSDAFTHLQAAGQLYGTLQNTNHRPAPVGGIAGMSPEQFRSLAAGAARFQMLQLSAGAGMDVTAVNQGSLHGFLGQYDSAIDLLKSAVKRHERDQGGSMIYRAMAAIYGEMGRVQEERDCIQREHDAGDTSDSGVGATIVGAILLHSSQQSAAAPLLLTDPSQPASQLTKAPIEGRFAVRATEAQAAESRGDLRGAIELWRRNAGDAESRDLMDGTRKAFAELQRLYAQVGEVPLSVYYGKRAVNQVQRERVSISTMDVDSRKSLVSSARSIYETLINNLIDAQRLAEAELALRLSREDEAGEFGSAIGNMPFSTSETKLLQHDSSVIEQWRRNAQERAAIVAANPFIESASNISPEVENEGQLSLFETLISNYESQLKTQPAASLSVAVQDLRIQVEAAFSAGECTSPDKEPRVTAIRSRLAALEKSVPPPPPESALFLASRAKWAGGIQSTSHPGLPNPTDRKGLRHYRCLMEAAQTMEESFAKPDASTVAALSAGTSRFVPVDEAVLEAQRHGLESQSRPTVIVHYFSGEHKLRILLTSASTRVVREVPVDRERLKALVDNFRYVIQRNTLEPRGAALELYEHLISPILADLPPAGTGELRLSLDAVLRPAPFAALWDGKQWLVQKYALKLVSFASVQNHSSAAIPDWRVAAFGDSRGDRELPPLASVSGELRSIVANPEQQASGPIPGGIWMDTAFTEQSLRQALKQHFAIIHIASHFVLEESDRVADSYLLLGDSSRLTLRQMKGDTSLRFDGVQLLTLSACETGLDGRNVFGQEIEGLASFAQAQGAAAVISSLWAVNDGSTARLMGELYRSLHYDHRSTVDALRSAQLLLIADEESAAVDPVAQRGGKPIGPGAQSAAAADLPSHPSRLNSHPFYWAPFVLTGG